jgi:hypothetical protein
VDTPKILAGPRGAIKMKQEDAKREIIAEWRALPKEQRQTDEQAAQFAMMIKDRYKFRGGSAGRVEMWRGGFR